MTQQLSGDVGRPHGWLVTRAHVGFGIQYKLHSMLVLHAFCNDWQPVNGATLLRMSGTFSASQYEGQSIA